MSFSRYPEYRFIGLEMLQCVPAKWKIVPAKHLLSLLTSGSRGWAEHYAESGELFFRIANLDRNSIRPKLDSVQYVVPPYRGEGERARIKEGDILVSITADLGSVCCASKKVSGGYVSQHVALARPIEKNCDSNWLAYFISGYMAKEQLLGAGYGGTKVQLSLQDIRELVVSLPSKEEQQKIAAFLDHETAKIDALIAEQQRLIELLKEKRQAVISHAVTKGLNPNAPMKDSGVEWLGDVPAHWKFAPMKHVVPKITVGIVVEPSKYYVDEGVPALRSLNVRPGKILHENYVYLSKEANELHRKSKIYQGDIVSVRSGQPGTSAVVPPELDGANCIDLIVIRKPSDGFSDYLCWFLESDPAVFQFSEGSGGAIQQHFNIASAQQLLVAWPPESEQEMILKFLNEECNIIDELIQSAQKLSSILTERRSAIISAAVTGKIDVRGWQPSESTSAPPVLKAAEEAASYG